MKEVPKILVLNALVLSCVLMVIAQQPASHSVQKQDKQVVQKPSAGKWPDFAQLRDRFTEAVGKDFDVVKDEFKRRSHVNGGGTFWLVHIKAKHSGYFVLNYRYNHDDPLYTHVEHDFPFRVGASGCRRGPPNDGSYSRFCIGDTIIVPISINSFTEHQFSLKATTYSQEEEATFEKESPELQDPGLDRAEISNPLAEHLRYLGRGSHKLHHRHRGYTLQSYADFQAQKPGRFNIALGVNSKHMPAGAPLGVGTPVNVPVIIVARDTPVTLLASRQVVRDYSRARDGRERLLSTGWDSFMTNLMILQPGDRISLTYHITVHWRDIDRKERDGGADSESVPLLITKLPFQIKSPHYFTEWLVDYLPQK